MTTDLLADQDLAALVRVSRPEHALFIDLRRPEPERFVATLAERGQHPYLHEFGWRHPVTVAELLRQLSVAVVRLSLPVHEHHDYALTGMRWRYLGAQAPRLPTDPGAGVLLSPGALPTRVELRLGPRSERDGKLAKLALAAELFAGDAMVCALELEGGFYPYAVLDGLMRRAVGDRVAPPAYPPRSPALAATLGLDPTLLLIAEPELLADGARRTAIVASSEHPFFHHNFAPALRRHVPAVLLLEAALQLTRCLPASGERGLEGIAVALREYVALNRLDTWLQAREDAAPEGRTRVTIRVLQGDPVVDKGSFELLLSDDGRRGE